VVPADQSDLFVGRSADLELLRGLARDVAGGRGRAVWVEGEPGIGKSSLLAVGLSNARRLGCETAWCVADELSQLLPLRLIMRSLAVKSSSLGAEIVEISTLLQAKAGTLVVGRIDPVHAAVERLLALVDRLCAQRPLVMVIDNLHWADDASLLACHQLALGVEQLPLLLVAACRPVPRRAIVDSTKTGLPSSDHFVGSGIAPTALSSKVSQNGWLHAPFDASVAASRPAATPSVAASRAPPGSPPPPPGPAVPPPDPVVADDAPPPALAPVLVATSGRLFDPASSGPPSAPVSTPFPVVVAFLSLTAGESGWLVEHATRPTTRTLTPRARFGAFMVAPPDG